MSWRHLSLRTGHLCESRGRQGESRGRQGESRGLACYLFALALLGVAACGGCGDEEVPDAATLSLRELLGMAPERVAELSAAERAVFAHALDRAWDASVAEGDEVLDIVLPDELAAAADQGAGELPSPLPFVAAYDRDRAAKGREVRPLGRVVPEDATEAQIEALPLPLEAIGLSVERGLVVQPVQGDERVFAGDLLFDEGWGRVELDALEGLSEVDAARRLEPVFRRYLHQVADTTAAPPAGEPIFTVRVAPAPRAPMALWYAPQHRALLVNPSLLYLLDESTLRAHFTQVVEEDVTWARSSHALEPDFISVCVASEKTRCASCFGAAGDPEQPACLPRLPGSVDPALECEQMTAESGRNARLYCYHLYAEQNLVCVLQGDPTEACGVSPVAPRSIEELQALAPMTTDEGCQQLLDQCERARLAPSGVVSPPPLVEPRHGASGSSWFDDCASECVAIGCDVGLQVLFEVACQACAESDSGGGDGCGSACEGDGLVDSDSNAADDDKQLAGGLLLFMPFGFLFGVWWTDRRHLLDQDWSDEDGDHDDT